MCACAVKPCLYLECDLKTNSAGHSHQILLKQFDESTNLHPIPPQELTSDRPKGKSGI